MPTGVRLRDPRATLLAAAEHILVRQGPGALTSRAVTDEAGLAKGVLHRHFDGIDDLIVTLVEERLSLTQRWASELRASAGRGSVVATVARTLIQAIDPVAIGLVNLAIARDGVRRRLRLAGHSGLPTLPETTAMLATYLSVERERGRITRETDPDVLARTLVGTGHLLLAGELGATPDQAAVEEVVEASLVSNLVPGRA
ncbi:TetR/AcrR family transcriptional regulator [Pseudonocardia sp. WMMC193]|uniref:TetR/AcrR family transcriptional regulator n=1 Tax=Pseudonocardia sp. WMMC193 TaxID=2911965 RepID=UPI001F42CBCF|nr:TetR/AcrR family transcriptional regulator [Pseudonocardia sp. WMMC193]MCF7550474.1 TetR/AcrR family transcriptional regulator [Pseudonocardia sp. WMMC193]